MGSPLFASTDARAEFERRIGTRALGKTIQFFEQTQSTNDLALNAARSGAAHGSVFIADAQDMGRGRRGRSWECAPGMGLLFSVLLRPAKIPPEMGGWIPLAAGLACVEALDALFDKLHPLSLKWPNDIIRPCAAAPGWKKLGGILCESALPALSSAPALHGAAESFAVIGIGLNLNQTQAMLPVTAKAGATSVRVECDATVDRTCVLKTVLERLEINLDLLSSEQGHAQIQGTIETKMRAWLPHGKSIVFQSPVAGSGAMSRRGVFAGLDAFGRIRILSDGVETAFADAEITAVE